MRARLGLDSMEQPHSPPPQSQPLPSPFSQHKRASRQPSSPPGPLHQCSAPATPWPGGGHGTRPQRPPLPKNLHPAIRQGQHDPQIAAREASDLTAGGEATTHDVPQGPRATHMCALGRSVPDPVLCATLPRTGSSLPLRRDICLGLLPATVVVQPEWLTPEDVAVPQAAEM